MTGGQRLSPDWLSAPETRRLVAALDEGGTLRFVGGCVRDSLIDRAVGDIDAATPHRPEVVLEKLQQAEIRAVPTGIEHGTVTAVVNGKPFEVTTLREDVETFGRHARVAFTDDWVADAARRDFTINALSLSPEGELHDPFGGREDLAAGRVRFVGEAEARILEDYLRILRFFRFQAHFGRGAPDAEALAAARRHAEKIKTLAAERLRVELMKLLQAEAPLTAIEAMIETGVAAVLLDQPLAPKVFAALLDLEERLRIPVDWLRRLAGLLAPCQADAEVLARRLRFSRAETRSLVALTGPEPSVAGDMMPEELRRIVYRHGGAIAADRLLLAEARLVVAGAPSETARIAAALDLLTTWRAPKLPVFGGDVRSLGLTAGPELGALLRAVEDWWLAQDFVPDRTACLAELRRLYEQRRENDL